MEISKTIICLFYYSRHETTSKTPLLESSNHVPYIAPTPNLTSVNLLNVATPKEDALFTYLNTPDQSPKRTVESFKSPSTTSSLLVEHPTDDTDSELSIHSSRASPTPTHMSIEMIPNTLDDRDAEIDTEEDGNSYLPEVQTVHYEDLNKAITEVTQNGNLILIHY